MPRQSREAKALDLITTQINFGLAYASEAKTAYRSGNSEYGDVARRIAMDAYSSATRNAAKLLDASEPAVSNQLTVLETELDVLWQSETGRSRSIA